ncbi:peptide N-acetyl-beta-D-glucosaminyl asparaginase amidase A [Terracoccus luteus]|uniref:Peptide N-acetyl-beta-D-glucosaminyl asparaginase amidase A n=2 Tax=Terracoccus luteus TaxID=53356 RepID=A0A495XXW9_9MICO|nr:peptide N-acetyl-beta-D-glucosaminyl asparaginase amidase A [Terracoccus luteus]
MATAPGHPASSARVTPPPEYAAAWDDPRTPEPPVAVPGTRRCTVRIVDHAFTNFDVFTQDFTPPAACAGGWSKVVMRLQGSVAGRQFDRLGYLDIGGVRALTLSTPEPSPTGITWDVEKDVTDLVPLLRSPQQVSMFIGNVVDDTYTGVLDVTVDLDFYVTGRGAPKAQTADRVLPLADQGRDGTDLTGRVTVPRNSTRLVAEVFATGSGGGCEEFWDTSAPAGTGYSCADGLPYREVDVSIDGQLAGVAAPYPVVYTGGWSNPFLWYTTPSPKAFDIPPLGYDLTPFLARLNDGRAHDVRVSVVGLPEGQSGWTLSPRFKVWRDAGSRVVTGTTAVAPPADPRVDATVTGEAGSGGSVALTGTRAFTAIGTLSTSAGVVTTSVQRSLENRSDHTWTAGEEDDVLKASWLDRQTVSTRTGGGAPVVERVERRYTKDGTLGFHPHPGIDGAYDVTGDLTILWRESAESRRSGALVDSRLETSWYSGEAAWIYGGPREERHATADTRSQARVVTRSADGTTSTYDRRLRSVNGVFVADTLRP